MTEKAEILIKGRDDTAQAWASVQQNASTAIGRINGLLPGLAAGLTAAGMISFAKHALDAGEQLNKMSQRTGISVEELSKLKYAAQQSDVDIEKLALGIKKLSTNAFEAGDKNSESAKTFRLLGVSAADATGKIRPTSDLLVDLADRFSKMQDGAGKSALAVRLFGKAGDELIPFLNQGREGIRQLTAEAEKLGIVMTKEGAEAAEKFKDSVKSIESASMSLGFAFINTLAPSIERVAKVMREATIDHGAFFGLLTGAGVIAIEMMGFGWKDAAERAAGLESELARLIPKQREYQAELLKDPNNKILQGWIKGVDWQIAAKQAELRGLQQLVDAKKKEDAAARNKQTVDAPTLTGKSAKPDVDETQKFLDKQNETADQLASGYERTKALLGQITEEAKVRYDTEFGKLSIVDDAIKANLITRAQELDAANAANAAFEEERQATIRGIQNETEQRVIAAENAIRFGQAEQARADAAEAFAKTKAEAFDQSTAQILMGLMTETEARQFAYDQDYDQLTKSLALKLLSEEQYQDALERLKKKYGDKSVQQRYEEERKKALSANIFGKVTLNDALWFSAQMGELMHTKSRKMFEIGKAGAISETVINTYAAAMASYKALASIPYVGPALGAAAAAAAIAVGMARVSAIKSTTFGNAGGGAVGTFSASPNTGLPESPSSSGFEQVAPTEQTQQSPRRNVFIHLEIVGEGLLNTQQVRSLIDQINEANSDGARIIVN